MKPTRMLIHFGKTKTKRRFSFVILGWMSMISIIPVSVAGYIWTKKLINQFNSDAIKIQTAYYNDQRKLIKDEVDEFIYDMEFEQKIIQSDSLEISAQTRKAMENKLKKEFLVRISKIRIGKEGYAFVNTTDHKSLIYDGKLLSKPIDIVNSGVSGWYDLYIVFRDSTVDGKGHFFKYPFKLHSGNTSGYKVSYARLYKPWGWIVGTGVYFDEITKTANIERAKLRENIKRDIIRFILIIFILIVILLISNKIINLTITHNIKAFKKIFSKAADDFSKVNLDTINYEEFRDLASSANKMIEDRNHFFDALNQEHILLRSLIDAVPNLIFLKDKDSRYIGCNQAFSEYIGHAESEIIGLTDYDLLGEKMARPYHESDKVLLEAIRLHKDEKKVMMNEELNTYPDGTKVRFETIKTTFNDVNGNVQGIIGISHDITARYEMEEQLKIAKEKAEESNRLKTAFLANMSHEIRTPLNAIIGFSNLLVFDDLTSEDKEVYSRLITQSGDSLANLVNDIVDMAKIESGQVDVENSVFKVNEIMKDLYVMFHEKAIHAETAIVVIYDPDLSHPELELDSDPFRIKQVIINLLNNALKFSEKGMITFGYRVKEGYCNFFVQDQGIGISNKDLEVIFDAFTQVDGTFSRKYGGVGLGLSISKRLIELMKGNIWVESEPGVGSTFTFRIPLN
ncbi:MAG: ATP-binding protein [Bacteroidota bacterium]|nr:ATP-binding protein [Bacteroidota bacterium]